MRVVRVVEGRVFTEGPVWLADGRDVVGVGGPVLLFSDLRDDRIWLYTEEGLAVYRSPSHGANGNALDSNGRIVSCEQETRTVSMTTPDGQREIVLDAFEGRRLNSPNDVVASPDGTLYFTDPVNGVADPDRQLPYQGVFRIGVQGEVELIADDLIKPNGVALSHDGSLLFVADTELGKVWSFELDDRGRTGRRRLVTQVPRPDGLAVHPDGRLFAACLNGIAIVEPGGSFTTLELPERPTNLVFGETADTLYVCAQTSVYRVEIG